MKSLKNQSRSDRARSLAMEILFALEKNPILMAIQNKNRVVSADANPDEASIAAIFAATMIMIETLDCFCLEPNKNQERKLQINEISKQIEEFHVDCKRTGLI